MTCNYYEPLLPQIKMGTRRLEEMLTQSKREQCGFVVVPVEVFETMLGCVTYTNSQAIHDGTARELMGGFE